MAATSTSAPLNLITARRRTAWNSRAALWIGRALVIVLVFVAWFIGSHSTDLVPPIGATMTQLEEAFSEGWILDPMWDTMKAVLGGFLIASVVGLGCGYALGRVRFLSLVFSPIIAGLHAVPRIIFYPVLLAAFGVTTTAKLWMGALSAFFPIVVSTAAGIKVVNPTLIKMGRSLNCSRWQLATKVFLPAAAPTIMVGLRIGFAVAFISVIFAEFFATVQGLGQLVLTTYGMLELAQMYAVVIVIVVIGVATNLLLWAVERKIRAAAE